MKNGTTKLLTLSTALAALGALTIVSQACTVITSDGTLDGGFTGTGDGSPPADSGPFNSCNECLFQGCTGQWAVCQNNTECMAIYTCTTAPSCASNQACIDACFTAHVAGQSSYYALATCDYYGECGSCASSCGGAPASCTVAPPADAGSPTADATAPPNDAAAPPFDGGAVQSCTDCTSSQCGAEKTACANGTKCDLYSQCLATCADVACIDKCGADNAEGKDASQKLGACVASHCASACGQ